MAVFAQDTWDGRTYLLICLIIRCILGIYRLLVCYRFQSVNFRV